MPSFGKTSIERLKTADEKLQKLFNIVIKYYDCSIIEGFRDEATQNKYFAEGKSKLKWPNGKHNSNPSEAVDVAPFIDGKISFNHTQCYHFAGFVLGVAACLGIPIRWGGNWKMDNNILENSFMDLVHFELKK